MDNQTLEKMYNYLPVIVSTCDRHGWDGNYGDAIPSGSIQDIRIFFTLLQSQIALAKIPCPAETIGDSIGAITILWDIELSSKNSKYDSFSVSFSGDGRFSYFAELESLSVKERGECDLNEDISLEVIEYIKFFK